MAKKYKIHTKNVESYQPDSSVKWVGELCGVRVGKIIDWLKGSYRFQKNFDVFWVAMVTPNIPKKNLKIFFSPWKIDFLENNVSWFWEKI